MSQKLSYPPELPVSAARPEILDALKTHQVVVVSGATGSGKTTQLPKMCLEIGRGTKGMIGHTQPRRLAARTVAARIASELGETLGKTVGYQIRFRQIRGEETRIKLMTDGILLAEISQDPLLKRYDTLIIDEAHERSLNIDFILGYLQRLVTKRPDLLVIITSATIDSQRFAAAFGADTPVIEVPGRTFPVEIRYRPLEELVDVVDQEESSTETQMEKRRKKPRRTQPERTRAASAKAGNNQIQGILAAVDELESERPGDILVFLAGERDIRETAAALRSHLGKRYTEPGKRSQVPGAVEVLALYSRLPESEQKRIFSPHPLRRIVLATNVAETSLTVPGIIHVIDTGVARISRYSNKTRVQRLPIEPISQASARQRQGRCGRLAPGICIRLYSEADFDSRAEFTEPEIQRTSLSSVILQMAALRLGEIEDFPFLDPPAPRFVTDGISELVSLGALDTRHRPARLTRMGRKLAKFPLDPHLARILVAADSLGVADAAVVIVAALAMQDVRERPAEKRDEADKFHARFEHPDSDFLAYLKLWSYLQQQSKALSGSAFRRLCGREFLHFLRVMEWRDLVSELREMCREVGIKTRAVEKFSISRLDTQSLHQALLTGMLGNIGNFSALQREYFGTRNTRFTIWPGSGVSSNPEWVMCAELVQTSRLFARSVAKVEPEWIEQAAKDHLKTSFYDPYWSTRLGAAMIHERISLNGLVLAADRGRTLASLGDTRLAEGRAREVAREMFVRHALVLGEWRGEHEFIAENARRINAARELRRRRQIPGDIDEIALQRWLLTKIDASVTSAAAFEAWWKTQRPKHPDWLYYPEDLLVPESQTELEFPDFLDLDGHLLPVVYTYSQQPRDFEASPAASARRGKEREIDVIDLPQGMSIIIDESVLEALDTDRMDWPVPAALRDYLLALVKALPKAVRKRVIPAGDFVAEIYDSMLQAMESKNPGNFHAAFASALEQARGLRLSSADLEAMCDSVASGMRNHFAIVDTEGKVLGVGDDFAKLRDAVIVKTDAAGTKTWDKHDEEKQKLAQSTNFGAQLAAALQLPVVRVVSRWRGAEAAALSTSEYSSTEAMVADAQLAAGKHLASQWVATHGELDEHNLQELESWARDRYEDTVYEVLQAAAQALQVRVELLPELGEPQGKATDSIRAEIVNHVNRLTGGEFLSRTPFERLKHLQRYLQADALRWEKARHHTAADQAIYERYVVAQQAFNKVETELAQKPVVAKRTAALQRVRWMLEEYRVSLFAQVLGTSEKVSAKRIDKALAQLQRIES